MAKEKFNRKTADINVKSCRFITSVRPIIDWHTLNSKGLFFHVMGRKYDKKCILYPWPITWQNRLFYMCHWTMGLTLVIKWHIFALIILLNQNSRWFTQLCESSLELREWSYAQTKVSNCTLKPNLNPIYKIWLQTTVPATPNLVNKQIMWLSVHFSHNMHKARLSAAYAISFKVVLGSSGPPSQTGTDLNS